MKNGRRGYDSERALFIIFADAGCLPFRSAASKGPYDLIIAMNSGLTLFVQVKRTLEHSRRWHAKTVRELMGTEPLWGIGESLVTWRKQVWCWVDRDKWYVTDWSANEAPTRHDVSNPIEWLYEKGFAVKEQKRQGMLDIAVAQLQ
jgi:Holliday junction resolvase